MSRWALLAISVVLGVGAALPSTPAQGASPFAHGAARSTKCRASQIRTVTYVKRPGGPKRTVRGCGVVGRKLPARVLSSTVAVPLALRESRLIADSAAPKRISRLQNVRAARLVLRADLGTSAAIAFWLGAATVGPTSAPRRTPRAYAASSVQTGSDNGPVNHGFSDGWPKDSPGTTTTMHRSGTEWSDNEPWTDTSNPNADGYTVSTGPDPEANPGFDKTITTETHTTRAQGPFARTTKTVRAKTRMARCPDGAGVGQGPVIYEEKITRVIDKPDRGHAVITETSTYTGTIKVQFGDDAHVASADLSGDWSYDTETRVSPGRGVPDTRVSHRAMNGTAQDNRLGPGGNALTVKVTGASDDYAALAGYPTGVVVSGIMPAAVAQDDVDAIERRALGGLCVHIVPNPTSVSVRPGDSAQISVHLADGHGGVSGRITTYVTSGSIAPSEGQANPDASFTYSTLASRRPGDQDAVVFNHVSRRGKANPATVQVRYQQPQSSHTYRIMAAQLDKTVTGDRSGDSFPGCPAFSNQENTTMTLGPQPPPTGGLLGGGQLFEGSPHNFVGGLSVDGPTAVTTTLHGCHLTPTPPFETCTVTGSATITETVAFSVTLPPTGPALVHWNFDDFPTAGLGSEGTVDTCMAPPIGWSTEDHTMGDQTVPRAVFEAATPQQLSLALDFRVTDPSPTAPAQIHALEHYSMTIQRVRDDGSPL